MKKNTIAIAIAIIGLCFASCGHNHNEGNKVESSTSGEGHQHDQAETIQLNNGEKWQVNPEMMPYITGSEEILADYIASSDADYKTLATKLKDKNSGLIESCTMKGASHEELHKWLHPHIELIDALSEAKDKPEAERIITELIESFDTFHTYFQ